MEQQFTQVFVFCLGTLGIEPRASDMLGKCSTIELHPQKPSTQVFMDEAEQIGSLMFLVLRNLTEPLSLAQPRAE